MLGTFLGLETATRGLRVQQTAIETVAHNVDNSNTPGYSRQRVDMTASHALEVPGLVSAMKGQMGTGVQVEQITRLRDSYLDDQYRQQSSYLGYWNTQQDALDKVTAIINEPSDTGISSVMQNFWNQWAQLGSGSNADTLSARTQVQQSAITLTQTLNQTAQQLDKLSSSLSSNLDANITQANTYISQIANLNKQITAVQNVGDQPNDLMDQRDLLVDKLSQVANIKVDQSGGTYKLSINGQEVLKDASVEKSITSTPHSPINPDELDVSTITDGVLGSIQDAISEVQAYHTNLDNIANSLATGQMNIQLAGDWNVVGDASGGLPKFAVDGQFADGVTFKAGDTIDPANFPTENIQLSTVNGQQVALIPQTAGATVTVNGLNGLQHLGFSQNGPGQDFFVSTDPTKGFTAETISVGVGVKDIAAALKIDPTSSSFVAMPGDGTLAITTDHIKDTKMTFPNPTAPTDPTQNIQGTLDDYLQSVVGRLGTQSQTANQQVSNQTTLVQQIDQQRQSVSGVSIDEEMSNMIKYQQSYGASAKMISTINDMLTTLINSVHN